MNSIHEGVGMTSLRTRERLVRRLQERGISNESVLDSVRNVPRHIFVDEALASRAYEDDALPIGHGQTISQPYIVARMTQALLESGSMEKVLEVGTGSGYQAAVLAPLVGSLHTVERIHGLYWEARKRVRSLDHYNVHFKHTDGTWGWPEQAPFDAIMVTAAPEQVPDELLQQLAIGGRLVIPVGAKGKQELIMITRTQSGFEQEQLCMVSFVPLIRGDTQ